MAIKEAFADLQDVLKTSARRFQHSNFLSSKMNQEVLRIRLQDVFKTSWKKSSKHLQVVFKTSWKTRNYYPEDVFKMSSRHGLKTFSRNVLKTSSRHVFKKSSRYILRRSYRRLGDQQNVYWEGIYICF